MPAVEFKDNLTYRQLSIFYFEFYCELLIALCNAEIETALNGYDNALPLWRALFALIQQREAQVKSVFDVFQFVNDFVFVRHRILRGQKDLLQS